MHKPAVAFVNAELISSEMPFKRKSQNIQNTSITALLIHKKTWTIIRKGIKHKIKSSSAVCKTINIFSDHKLVQAKLKIGMATYRKRRIDTNPSNLQLNIALTARSLRRLQLNWDWRLIKSVFSRVITSFRKFPIFNSANII